jgi:hypothetical protein
MTNWTRTEERISALGFACKNKVQFFQVREYYNKSQESFAFSSYPKNKLLLFQLQNSE